ncbi:MAG: NADH-quinone oxidoreductase subunit NuoK [Nitrospirae bacterium]|nr:NADH-quinone oxidoreductase subunit NuoK [Nitrospirota bacterium]MBI5694871.1 NADH-quinone oxidoreductase subunit NuoK [Nitrospirota bacterium]
MVPLNWYIALSAAVFCIGVAGVLSRRNIIIIFLSIELILNSVNILLVAYSHFLNSMRGQVFVFFIMAVAAAEAAIGLAIIIALYRNKETVLTDEINLMKW